MKRGTKLRQLRRLQDLKQNDIAFELGISQKQVSRIENGLSQPRIDLLDAWCALLGLTVRKLDKMCEQEPEPPRKPKTS